jgi:hypothetical protein
VCSAISWTDFLGILKKYKTLDTEELHLDAGSLLTMLYAGELDSIIECDPTVENYSLRGAEIKKAMGSKAQDKKAAKNEDYGIVDINESGSDIVLKLWRSESNPVYQFSWMEILHEQILAAGYKRRKSDHLIPYSRDLGGDKRHDIWSSWGSLCNNGKAISAYLGAQYVISPSFVGIIVESSKMRYSNGLKEAIKFSIFTGTDETETITCWPKKDENKVNEAIARSLKKGAIGIAAVNLKMWNDRVSPSLAKWTPLEAEDKKKL